MKHQRIYTKFLLPDGDEITLSFRQEKDIHDFQDRFTEYKLIYKNVIHPKGMFDQMKAVFTYNKGIKNTNW